MEQKYIFILIGMSLVTYIPRVIPLVLLTRFELPPIALQWLKYIPVAVLSALLVPGILMQDGRLLFSMDNDYLIASLPCIIVAIKTKNLFVTVSTGIACMFLLNVL